MDWTSPVSSSDSSFVDERFKNTADSMNLSLFCGDLSKLLTRNFWKPLLFLLPGWLVFYQGSWSKCRRVVELPEELEISSLGNLASSSRRFNLQLQAQEAWRQVCLVSGGEIFPVEKLGEAKSYWRSENGVVFILEISWAPSIFWKEIRLEWWLLYQSFVASCFF